MEEQANQSEVMTIEDIDMTPEGYDYETDSWTEEEETTEPTEVEEVEEDEPVEEKEEEPVEEEVQELLEDLEVKFLHETKALKDIPKEELQAYLQKGMNHDRLQGKLTEAKEITDDFNEVADMFGMDTGKLLDSLKQQYFDRKAKDEQRNVNDVMKEYESGRKSLQDKAIDRFNDKFPDVAVDSLPESVVKAVAMGEDLSSAYDSHLKDEAISSKDSEIETLKGQLAELEKQVKVSKQNEKVKKKGVVKQASGADDKTDDFLSGLFGQI